jgi:hypothetical protein
MRAVTKVGKVAEWKQRLRRYKRTELTVAEFCRLEGISVPSLYQWQRKLAVTAASKPRELMRAAFPSEASGLNPPAAFRAIEVSPELSSGLAMIRLPSGVVIELPDSSPVLKWVLGQVVATNRPAEGGPSC